MPESIKEYISEPGDWTEPTMAGSIPCLCGPGLEMYGAILRTVARSSLTMAQFYAVCGLTTSRFDPALLAGKPR